MQLGIWAPANMKVAKGDAELIKYELTPGSVSRNSCSKCGSFCYKVARPIENALPYSSLCPITLGQNPSISLRQLTLITVKILSESTTLEASRTSAERVLVLNALPS